MRDLSFPIRDQTQAPRSESSEPQPRTTRGVLGAVLSAVQTLIPLWFLITFGGGNCHPIL